MFYYRYIKLVFVFFIFSNTILCQNQSSLIIDNQFESNLSNCILVYEDTSCELGINEIINLSDNFKLPELLNNEVFIDFSDNTHWFKFQLINKSHESRSIILDLKNAFIWDLELYSFNSNELRKYPTTGNSHKFHSRQINHKYFAYELILDPLKEHTFFIKINNNEDAYNLPIYIYIPSKFNQEVGNSNIFNGLFYGIIISILLTSFFFWLINIKGRGSIFYLWFFMYVLLIGLFNFTFDGFSFQYFWPNNPGLNRILFIVFPVIAMFFLARFTCGFFDIKKNTPLLSKLLQYLGYAILITAILPFTNILPYEVSISLIIILAVLLSVLITFTSLKLYSQSPKLSLYFSIAFITLLAGLLLFGIYQLGFGLNYHTNNIVMKLSIISQVIILTIALSAKMSIQQNLMYYKSITNLKEAKELKEKLYSELERKVNERTKELTLTKDKIEEANLLIHNKNKDLEKAFKKSSNHYIKLQKALKLINEQKQNLEEANKEIQESSRLKEIFLANTSHEIRTPLNAIVGFTNLLVMSDLSEQQSQYINNIKSSGENLLVVINDILDFSKIEAGKLKFEIIDFNLIELFDNLFNTFKAKAEEKGINLFKNIGTNVPSLLMGDPVRLNQIFINLLGNAIKFTGKGGNVNFSVEVDNSVVKPESITLAFRISDTGIGIAKDNLEDIFESFTQAESDTTRKYGGTGLGLSIVKQLVELQKGTITIESELNKGTEFKFILNYLIGSKHPTVSFKKQNTNLAECHPKDLKILVVEDNDINQKLAKDTLLMWNKDMEVDIASSGNIAIQKSFEKKYSVLLMDIQMPQMDGFETTQIIRNEKDSLNRNTPIIAMTAHTMKDELDNCLQAGMNDYISKPFDPDQLFAKIKHYTCKKVTEAIQNNQNDLANINCDIKETVDNDIESPTLNDNFTHISLKHFHKLYKGDESKIKKILLMYIESIPNEINKLKEGFITKDWNILKVKAHVLKPKLGYIGMKNSSESAKKIEELAKEQNSFDLIEELVQNIETDWDNSLKEIESYIL